MIGDKNYFVPKKFITPEKNNKMISFVERERERERDALSEADKRNDREGRIRPEGERRRDERNEITVEGLDEENSLPSTRFGTYLF